MFLDPLKLLIVLMGLLAKTGKVKTPNSTVHIVALTFWRIAMTIYQDIIGPKRMNPEVR